MLKPDEDSPFRLNKAGLGQTFVVPGLILWRNQWFQPHEFPVHLPDSDPVFSEEH